jgi:hypothetical protein
VTGRQATFGQFEAEDDQDRVLGVPIPPQGHDEGRELTNALDEYLTVTEMGIYLAVEIYGEGVREYQRRRGWSSPGTASNLLRRARRKLPEGSA